MFRNIKCVITLNEVIIDLCLKTLGIFYFKHYLRAARHVAQLFLYIVRVPQAELDRMKLNSEGHCI
jgi:hypothetical protein